MRNTIRAYLAEFFGTAALVSAVVGSGIMATSLTSETALALLINAISTILTLGLLILILAPVSGAQFNPAVTLVALIRRQLGITKALAFVLFQILGGIVGSLFANSMFDQAAIQIASQERVSTGTLLGEVIATAGLVSVIFVLANRSKEELIPMAVAGWIGAAYFFTSSTSFANPAVTIGRVFTDSFAGIAPESVLPFIAAQLFGAGIGMLIIKGVNSERA